MDHSPTSSGANVLQWESSDSEVEDNKKSCKRQKRIAAQSTQENYSTQDDTLTPPNNIISATQNNSSNVLSLASSTQEPSSASAVPRWQSPTQQLLPHTISLQSFSPSIVIPPSDNKIKLDAYFCELFEVYINAGCDLVSMDWQGNLLLHLHCAAVLSAIKLPFFHCNSFAAVSFERTDNGELVIQLYEDILDPNAWHPPFAPSFTVTAYIETSYSCWNENGRVAIDINNGNLEWRKLEEQRQQLIEIYDIRMPPIYALPIECITTQAIQDAEDKAVNLQLLMTLLSVGMKRTHAENAVEATRRDLLSYNDSLVQDYQSRIVGMQNVPQSGQSYDILLQRQRNDDQDISHDTFLDGAVELAELVSSRDGMLDMTSPNIKLINTKNELFSMDVSTKQLYHKGDDNKIGRAGNATEDTRRINYYRDLYKSLGIPLPQFTSILDFDNMEPQLQLDMVEFILKEIAEPLRCDRLPTTYADALRLEREGLPLALQMTLWGISKDLGECDRLGGSIDISGNLINLVQNVMEIGTQEMLKREGHQVSGDVYEPLGGNMLGYYGHTMPNIKGACCATFNCDALAGEKRSLLLNLELLVKAKAAWPAGKTLSSVHRLNATEILMDQLVDGRENWDDFLPYVPHRWIDIEKMKSKHLYDAEGGYIPGDWTFAFGNFITALFTAEHIGGVFLLNWSAKMMLKAGNGMTMVQFILLRRPFGEDGARWKIACEFLDVTVLYLDKEWKNTVHLLFVHPPPCPILQSDTSIDYDDTQHDIRMTNSIGWQYINECIRIIKTPNASLESYMEESILDINVESQVFFNSVIDLHCRQYQHVYCKAASQNMKNHIQPININHPSETGLYNRSGRYFGKSARKRERRRQKRLLLLAENAANDLEDDSSDDSSSDEESDDESSTRSPTTTAAAAATSTSTASAKPSADDNGKMTINANFRRLLVYAISQRTSTPDDAVELLLFACRYDIFGDDSKVSDPNSRYKIIMDCDGLIDDHVLQEFHRRYKATTQNKGNTTSNRKSDKVATRDVDTLLREVAAKGENITCDDNVIENAFFIMCAGSADRINPKKYSVPGEFDSPKVDFELPETGTVLGTWKINWDGRSGGGRMKKIVFDRNKFVPITWYGLNERIKSGAEPKGNTNAQQSVKFYDKKLKRAHQGVRSHNPPHMIRLKAGSSNKVVGWINENVVLVWLIDK